MKCPHCLVEIFDHESDTYIDKDKRGVWVIHHQICPHCSNLIAALSCHRFSTNPTRAYNSETQYSTLIYPKTISRSSISDSVPQNLKQDYYEACYVLGDSPKASAALSRRCLQSILRETAKVKHGTLEKEIEDVLEGNTLPSHLAQSLDSVRTIGNFAAHPTKSKSTGEIVEVEFGEAEWNLDVVESLFDFYFVQPDILKKKREALNAKLKDAGKPELK